MKKFILWLAKVFKVNLNEIEGDLIIKGDLKVTGNVTMYYIDEK